MAISKKPFGQHEGRSVSLYTLTNASGASVSITDLGAIVTSIIVPDKDGKLEDIALGFDTIDKYIAPHGSMGDTIGRFANRIAGSAFEIDGVTYKLEPNDGENHLHGVFPKRVWDCEEKPGEGMDGLRLHLTSPDGEEGYPGTMEIYVTFTWSDACALTIRYEATTDKATVFNMTNHAYFNLAGHAAGSVAGHELTVFADAITLPREGLIPTGDYLAVAGTPFDMRAGKRLGDGLALTESNPIMKMAGGYDHNFVLRKGEAFGTAAILSEPISGRRMEVVTDQPGMQLYTACTTDLPGGKGGAHYGKYSGLCLETHHFPDSPHHPNFPGKCILRPGEKFDSTTVYVFGTV